MKNDQILWVDFIRVVSTFSVVWLHSASPLLYRYNSISLENWWIGNIYDATTRVCVPLFFIITGYLLLGKQEEIRYYLTKRIKKILVPFIVWSLLYSCWKYYFKDDGIVSFRIFYSLFLTPTYYHLWFFYAIIGMYLYVPILRILIQRSQPAALYYFVIIWFIAASVIPAIETVTQTAAIIDLNMPSGHVGYLAIGYLLGNARIDKRTFNMSLLIAFACLLTTIIGTFFLTTRNNGELDEYFRGYLSPNIILQSASAFILLKYLSENANFSDKSNAVLKTLSSTSFGIYLIHPMILSVLDDGWLGFSLSAFSANAIYSVPLTAILAFWLSFAIIFLLQKIPVIRTCVL